MRSLRFAIKFSYVLYFFTEWYFSFGWPEWKMIFPLLKIFLSNRQIIGRIFKKPLVIFGQTCYYTMAALSKLLMRS